MKFTRIFIAYLLIAALPLSALASIGVPCTQLSDTELRADIAGIDLHAHHDAGASADRSSHHAATASTDVDTSTCPCCDNCETTCVISGCNPIALTTLSRNIAVTGTENRFPQADGFRDGPPPHVLFRPPIFSI